MTERLSSRPQSKEVLSLPRKTRLSMIVDPPNQTPEMSAERVEKFLNNGGSAVLIGGSGIIEPTIFHETVDAITRVASASGDVPVWILPGHISQIPKSGRGISGVLNYEYILGNKGEFENAYPKTAREHVARTLAQRQIVSIPTLYILCGDPNASVSQVSGILPLDLSLAQAKNQFLNETGLWLTKGVDCVFIEAGSNSLEPVNRDAALQIRNLIDKKAACTTLIISGGIKTPKQVALFTGIADYVNIGGHFEKSGMENIADFVRVLN